MCVYSNVMDHYNDRIPWEWQPPTTPIAPFVFPSISPTPLTVEEVRKIIKEFREAEEAAKKLDELMGQANCVDPEKAKLLERVAELEAQLAALGKEKAKPAKRKKATPKARRAKERR